MSVFSYGSMNGPNNKIGWCDYTWNVITGCKGNDESKCYEYCYARKIYDRFGWDFTPNYHPERLAQPLAVDKPSLIFVSSVSDFWGSFIEEEWRRKVLAMAKKCYWHQFLFLTKCVSNIPLSQYFHNNISIGVTVTNNSEIYRLTDLKRINVKSTFASIEPIRSYIELKDYELPDWLIVGAQTGPDSVKPEEWWIEQLVATAGLNNIPIYLKDNLKYKEKIKQFPDFKVKKL